MSNDCIDNEARDRIAELGQRHRALEVIVHGAHGENGIKAKVGQIDGRLESIEEWRSHYLDAERRETCYGLAACEEENEEGTQVQVAEIAAKAAVEAAQASARGQVNREWVVIAGMGLLLLKDVLVPLLKAVPK